MGTRLAWGLAAIAFAVASGAPAQEKEYGWTISASSTDPFANTTPATFGVETYYLWFYCELNNGCGMGAAEAELELTGPELLG